MRYREGYEGALVNDAPPPRSDEFVTATVLMTLIIGVIFTAVGWRAKQRWLVFWGVLTLFACGWYFVFVS